MAGGPGTSAIMVVEFKRPGRDDYALGKDGYDPIKQVNDTVKQMRMQKRFVTSDGATINIPTTTPITAFIVADLEPKLRGVAEDYDFTESWDKTFLFRYHDGYDVYIEMFGYGKLLEDAKQRNSPFFDVLLNEIGS